MAVDSADDDLSHYGSLREKDHTLLSLSSRDDAMLGQILQGSPIPTFVVNHKHLIVHWNRALEVISGFPAKTMIGTDQQWITFYPEPRPVLADLIIDDEKIERIRDLYEAVTPSTIIEDAYETEDFFPTMGENGRWLYFTAAPLRDETGRIVGAIETLQDVTDRKFAEMALRKHQDELEELINSRTTELTRVNEELSQYAYVVAHDLRSPLRAMRNYTDFLLEDFGSSAGEEQQVYFTGLKKALHQGELLVTDLLEYASVGRRETSFRPIDLGTLLHDTIDLMTLSEDADVIWNDSWPTVRGDYTLLKQVFQNLLSNAIKFNQANPKQITLGWRALNERECEVFIRDNGIGIDAKYYEHIFRMFQRLHTDNEYPGTGIGLAIIKKAITRLEGNIRIESMPGQGSTFFVTLPLAIMQESQ
ncbi:MAG: ATP-binding protein [Pseudomonadota bacterium]